MLGHMYVSGAQCLTVLIIDTAMRGMDIDCYLLLFNINFLRIKWGNILMVWICNYLRHVHLLIRTMEYYFWKCVMLMYTY